MPPFPSSAPRTALALLLVTACAGRPATPAPTTTPAPAEPAAPPAEQFGHTVTLLEAGAEPRAPLRLVLAKGHRETVTMVMRSRQAVAPWNGAPPLALERQPTSRTVMTLELTDGGGERATQVMRITDTSVAPEPDVDDNVERATDAALRTIIGMTTTGTIDDRGRVTDERSEYPATVQPMMRKVMEGSAGFSDSSLSFPAEPIGVGARWRIESHTRVGGITADRRIDVQLVKIEGDQVFLTLQIAMTAAPQPVASPILMPGQTLDLVTMTGEGTGELVLDRRLLGPVRARQTVMVRSKMIFRAEGQEVTLGLSNESEVIFETAP